MTETRTARITITATDDENPDGEIAVRLEVDDTALKNRLFSRSGFMAMMMYDYARNFNDPVALAKMEKDYRESTSLTLLNHNETEGPAAKPIIVFAVPGKKDIN